MKNPRTNQHRTRDTKQTRRRRLSEQIKFLAVRFFFSAQLTTFSKVLICVLEQKSVWNVLQRAEFSLESRVSFIVLVYNTYVEH